MASSRRERLERAGFSVGLLLDALREARRDNRPRDWREQLGVVSAGLQLVAKSAGGEDALARQLAAVWREAPQRERLRLAEVVFRAGALERESGARVAQDVRRELLAQAGAGAADGLRQLADALQGIGEDAELLAAYGVDVVPGTVDALAGCLARFAGSGLLQAAVERLRAQGIIDPPAGAGTQERATGERRSKSRGPGKGSIGKPARSTGKGIGRGRRDKSRSSKSGRKETPAQERARRERERERMEKPRQR